MEAHHHLDTGDVDLAYSSYGDGPLVICAHGFPDCAHTFREQVPTLVGAGYRVVTPTMRAYAPSSKARSGRYDAAALATDLLALANFLSPHDPVVLLGHDWGAVAVYATTHMAPHRVRKIATVAVPHLRVALPRWLRPTQLRKSWYMGLFQLSGYSEARVLNDNMALIDELWRAWSPGYRSAPEEMDRIKAAIRPHVGEVLGYYRALRRVRRDARRAVMAKVRVPALYIHGIDDGCIGVDMTAGIAKAYEAGLEVHHLHDAGHFVHLEQPDRFNELLLGFLRDG
jgi:pimeloyl-ACP methyl ester carboxylesterase